MPETAAYQAPSQGRPPEATPHVLAAVSAREVTSVLNEIRTMYVVGLNAQVAVGRAGTQAAGFGRISERLNHLSGEISELIGEANDQAVAVSRLTYKVFMARRAYLPLESAAPASWNGSGGWRWGGCVQVLDYPCRTSLSF